MLQTRGGELRLRKPLIYQEVGGTKRSVPGGYVVRGERGVGFQVAAYDGTKPLIIDPVLVYSTYLGGFREDNGSGIAADATGIYLAGLTVSPDFPTPGSPSRSQVGDYDAFVTKLNPAGTALIYSTYLGGNGYDFGLGLAVDAAGNAHVTGLTASTDFPTTVGSAFQGTNGGALRCLPDEAQCVRLRASLLHVPRRHPRRPRVRRGARCLRQCLCRGPDELDRLPGEHDALSGDQRRRHGRLRGQAEPIGLRRGVARLLDLPRRQR